MSEETTKANNTITAAAIVALVVGIGYFAFNSNNSANTTVTTVATVEDDQVVEEVVVIADQEPTEVTAEMVVNSTDDTPEGEVTAESSEDKSE